MSKHLARIAQIDKVQPIPNADKIQTALVFGFEVIVSKDKQVGDIGVFFEASDTQLSHEYCHNNNLYRHAELNIDQTKVGYVEDNKKLKVQRFLKVKSEGLFMPLDSLAFTGYDLTQLKKGDAFEILAGITICQKWMNDKTRNASGRLGNSKKIKNIQTPCFKEHVDTEQLAYFIDTIPKSANLSITHKMHGTSHRVAYTKTIRKVKTPIINNTYVRHLNRNVQSIRYEDTDVVDYEYVAGSRRVVLLDEHQEKEGYHGSEKWRFDILDQFKPYLEKNMTVYMEVVGYVNGAPIMGEHDITKLKDEQYTKKYGKRIVYKYGCLETEYKIMVYRITMTNDDGVEIDFTPRQLAEWCSRRNIPHTMHLVEQFIYDGDKDKLFALVKNLAEREDKLCEDYIDPSHINEGVVIRVDDHTLVPRFYKYKTFCFRVLENIIKINPDYVDMEDAS